MVIGEKVWQPKPDLRCYECTEPVEDCDAVMYWGNYYCRECYEDEMEVQDAFDQWGLYGWEGDD